MRIQNTSKPNSSNRYMSTSYVIIGILTIMVIGIVSMNEEETGNAVHAQTVSSNQIQNNSLTTNNTFNNATETAEPIVTVFPANFTRAMGTISSIQNNESGDPSWILSGNWELLIPKPLKINQTNPSDSTPFNAIFEMVKTDGTMRHIHTVSDFNLTGSQANRNALVLTGTATVTMKEGPVKNVPVSLSIVDQDALKLWIYPSVASPELKDYHFGKTPIYGLVSSIGAFFVFP